MMNVNQEFGIWGEPSKHLLGLTGKPRNPVLQLLVT
jgi:hypothetical protein